MKLFKKRVRNQRIYGLNWCKNVSGLQTIGYLCMVMVLRSRRIEGLAPTSGFLLPDLLDQRTNKKGILFRKRKTVGVTPAPAFRLPSWTWAFWTFWERERAKKHPFLE